MISPNDRESHRRELETMLVNARRFEDISKIAGEIAHDLNNLLAPIRMATQLLKSKLDDRSLDRYVEIIETSTSWARTVIQEILTFSRETEVANRQAFAVNPIIEEFQKTACETYPETVCLECILPETSPIIMMDPTQLHRVILNLLSNARDAIGTTGKITLQVEMHDLDLDVQVGEMALIPGRFVRISVSDTGCGIPEDIRSKIFDPFFTTKSKEEGTGLGLASVYGIIARSGGFVKLDTVVGEGSTFHIYIPEAE